jgi:hypothetical protein
MATVEAAVFFKIYNFMVVVTSTKLIKKLCN